MPSLQTALPPELANNVIRLYRECLRRAKYVGHQKHNTALVVDMVRQQFKKHKHETDPEKIQKLKDEWTVDELTPPKLFNLGTSNDSQ
ncbi:uncharacterized protein LOC116114390 isoform X2 [Pistacia vera]|uniref:uncharacterized protein LOC116114390 isoform X2 n=1 Tax=Pistacia vera TaxID=55513 RepID=UPI00126308C9|nr:uncharacterized protein LOC116114390 isoform X2 [Pistacia vera]